MLRANPTTRTEHESTDIGVTTLKGEVQLSGYARSETEKQRAAVIARDIEGVQSVSNRIEVKDN